MRLRDLTALINTLRLGNRTRLRDVVPFLKIDMQTRLLIRGGEVRYLAGLVRIWQRDLCGFISPEAGRWSVSPVRQSRSSLTIFSSKPLLDLAT